MHRGHVPQDGSKRLLVWYVCGDKEWVECCRCECGRCMATDAGDKQEAHSLQEPHAPAGGDDRPERNLEQEA
jgi:hypothetical protein